MTDTIKHLFHLLKKKRQSEQLKKHFEKKMCGGKGECDIRNVIKKLFRQDKSIKTEVNKRDIVHAFSYSEAVDSKRMKTDKSGNKNKSSLRERQDSFCILTIGPGGPSCPGAPGRPCSPCEKPFNCREHYGLPFFFTALPLISCVQLDD